MKRSSSLRRTSSLSRGPGPTRKTRVKARNARRRAAEWARAYGSPERVEFVRSLGCLLCRVTPAENAHIKTGGTGRKANADQIVPLCSHHHRLLHTGGVKSFEHAYGAHFLSQAAEWVERAWSVQQLAAGD